MNSFISIVVCVEYDDMLRLTLPHNAQRFEKTFVITTPEDTATLSVVRETQGAYQYATRAFYDNGDHFNKGRAIDDLLQLLADWRLWVGWCCHWDADILLPANFSYQLAKPLEVECLYAPRCRRGCEQVSEYHGERNWAHWPVVPQGKLFDAGWCQLFHRAASPLASRPFYPREWGHAGNSDTFFNDKWPDDHKKQLPLEVLHFGTPRTNWHGRHTPRVDGSVPDNARLRREWMTEMDRVRRQNNTLDYERTQEDAGSALPAAMPVSSPLRPMPSRFLMQPHKPMPTGEGSAQWPKALTGTVVALGSGQPAALNIGDTVAIAPGRGVPFSHHGGHYIMAGEADLLFAQEERT